MRAVVHEKFGGPEVLEARELPDPEPGTGEVLVQIRACGVCGYDLMGRSGALPPYRLPMTPGHEFAGEVVALGPGVSTFRIGDRVATKQRRSCGVCDYCRGGRETVCHTDVQYGGTIPGGYAELCAVDSSGLVIVPSNVPWPDAAIAACTIGTVLHALKLARLGVGERVLVTGAGGGLGLHAVQIAHAAGCEVIAVTSSPAKRELINAMAAHVIVDPNGFHQELRDLDLLPDVVLEMTAALTLNESLRAVKRTGRVVIIGNVLVNPVSIVPGALISREISIIGANSSSRSDLQEAMDLISRGVVRPAIAQVIPLMEAAKAHALAEERRTMGRLVLDPML